VIDHTPTIKQFIVEEFMPDIAVEQLDSDYDLLDGAVIDSLGLLQVIAWLEDTFDLALDDAEIGPDNFRSVQAMQRFIAQSRN
jgi:D-alanine--poly(phosphoribitol) ligase subunit 2